MKTTGLVWLAYTSKIDGSDQPYALIVPESWQPRSPFRHRLDIWFHGRGETRTEVAFYDERRREPGEFTPEDTFVLHPYGRFCNAAKFAGEVDAFEALDEDVESCATRSTRIGSRYAGSPWAERRRGTSRCITRGSGSPRIRGQGSRRLRGF